MREYADVAIIILNYVSWEATLKEAAWIRELFSLEWEQIIIIDNASPNESSVKLKENAIGNYQFIENDKNVGYAKGNNIGLKLAKKQGYRYAWILNNDVMVEDKELLRRLLQVFSIDKKVAIVNPDIYSLEGKIFNRDSKRFSFWDMTLGMVCYRKKGREIEDLGGYGYVYRPQGCCMLMDLEKLAEVNYLDENTFLYCEEMIVSERLLRKNYLCACATDIHIVHDHSRTVKLSLKKQKIIREQVRSFRYYLNTYRYYHFAKEVICLFFFALKSFFTV